MFFLGVKDPYSVSIRKLIFTNVKISLSLSRPRCLEEMPSRQHSLRAKNLCFSLNGWRLLLRFYSFWPGLRSPTATKSNAAVVRAMGHDAVGGIEENDEC